MGIHLELYQLTVVTTHCAYSVFVAEKVLTIVCETLYYITAVAARVDLCRNN